MLIAVNDMIADMLTNKKLNLIVTAYLNQKTKNFQLHNRVLLC